MRRLAALCALALMGLVLPAHAGPLDREGGRGLVQPGMALNRNGSQWCTGGFLLDGTGRLRGRVFLATAAHCYEHRIGERVYDEHDRAIGRVVYSHWPYTTFADDIGLIEVDRSVWKRTTPEMAGHPGMPTGIGNGENIHVGDRVGYAGWGFATDYNSTTREQRPGVLNSYDSKLWGAEGPVSNGDSGGPLVDLDSGAAVGSISNYCVPLPVYTSEGFVPGCTGYGPTMEQLVRLATAQGWPVALRRAAAGRPR
jgi:hypothetical protein